MKWPQILLLQGEHLIQITCGLTPSTACAQWASALFRGKGLLGFCEYGNQFNSLCTRDYWKTTTGAAQGGVFSFRAHICTHVSWQVNLFDFHTSRTSYRINLAWSPALAALSLWWPEVVLPLYAANQHRNYKTQLLKGGRALRGEKHEYAESQNNQFTQEFCGVPCHWVLHSPHPVLQNQGLILPDKSADLCKRLFFFRASVDLHTQSWRVTMVNGADSSFQFQFVVLQYNWLRLNTLWARAGRSAPSLSLIFLHTPLIHLLLKNRPFHH